jgi:hypothetical protein
MLLLIVILGWLIEIDAFGLLSEFKYICAAAVIFPISSITTRIASPPRRVDTTILYASTVLPYIVVWCSTVVRALYLSYRHQWKLAERSTLIANVTKLEDLLNINEGYNGKLINSNKLINITKN